MFQQGNPWLFLLHCCVESFKVRPTECTLFNLETQWAFLATAKNRKLRPTRWTLFNHVTQWAFSIKAAPVQNRKLCSTSSSVRPKQDFYRTEPNRTEPNQIYIFFKEFQIVILLFTTGFSCFCTSDQSRLRDSNANLCAKEIFDYQKMKFLCVFSYTFKFKQEK